MLALAMLTLLSMAGCGGSQPKAINSGKDMPKPAEKGR